VARRKVTVALTAYNDEDSIAAAVEDFLQHPLVERVIVVSNNSNDRTFKRAEEAGAITFNEPAPGYGRCMYRCLSEARHMKIPSSSSCAKATALSAPTTSRSCSPTRLMPTW
jgi:glycosyltransferase involved in cell wall biosynthesis